MRDHIAKFHKHFTQNVWTALSWVNNTTKSQFRVNSDIPLKMFKSKVDRSKKSLTNLPYCDPMNRWLSTLTDQFRNIFFPHISEKQIRKNWILSEKKELPNRSEVSMRSPNIHVQQISSIRTLFSRPSIDYETKYLHH